MSAVPHLLGAMLCVGCASIHQGGPVPHPFPMPTAVTASAGNDAADTKEEDSQVLLLRHLLDTALALRGTPYRNGGSDANGFDCSGFIQFVFGQHGVRLPRGVREQYQLGQPVDRQKVEPGDLVFFSTTSPGPSHVAIALGSDDFVHAPSSRGVVRIENLSAHYWSSRLIEVRRLRLR